MSELVLYRIGIVVSLTVSAGLVIWLIRGARVEDTRPLAPGEKLDAMGWIAIIVVGVLVWLAFGAKVFDGMILDSLQRYHDSIR
ncbi:MAG: hypothetical protein ABSC03_00150 [Verrucomicrobiota bacterium]|jgi:nicotinamide riboside transporter PnuC